MDGKDVILVMPTGGGKSLTYQLPAMLSSPTGREPGLPSFTVVISPLLSLMHDQKMNLERLDISPGTVVVFDASTSVSDQTYYLNMISGKNMSRNNSQTCCLRLLYVTPEKLAKSKRLLNRLETAYAANRLSRLVIDEIHCVSQWGHDFRTDYQMLHILRRQFPNVPLLGLTATASAEVIVDIQSMLNIAPERCLVLRSGYNRTNLDYAVQTMAGTVRNSSEYLHQLIQTRYPGQSESPPRLHRIDVTGLVLALSDLLADTDSRVTGPKLVDLLRTSVKGPERVVRLADPVETTPADAATLPFLSKKGPLPKPFYEHFVAWCLVRHLLQFDFHYTPYSTVCYLVPTDKLPTGGGSSAGARLVMPCRLGPTGLPVKRTASPSNTSMLPSAKGTKA